MCDINPFSEYIHIFILIHERDKMDPSFPVLYLQKEKDLEGLLQGVF